MSWHCLCVERPSWERTAAAIRGHVVIVDATRALSFQGVRTTFFAVCDLAAIKKFKNFPALFCGFKIIRALASAMLGFEHVEKTADRKRHRTQSGQKRSGQPDPVRPCRNREVGFQISIYLMLQRLLIDTLPVPARGLDDHRGPPGFVKDTKGR